VRAQPHGGGQRALAAALAAAGHPDSAAAREALASGGALAILRQLHMQPQARPRARLACLHKLCPG